MNENEKPYDLKVLTDRLKVRGLNLLEDELKIVVEEVANFVVESAAKSESPYDDMLALIMPMAKKQLLALVDKVDGEEG